MFLLVEDGLAKEDAYIEIFVDEEGLGDGGGVVKHGDGDGDFVVGGLLLFGLGVVLHFSLEEVEAGVDVVELLEEEVLHVLGVGLDHDADVAVVLFELAVGESPVGLHQFQAFLVLGLEEHIGLVGDVVGPQKCPEGFLEVQVFKVPTFQYARVVLSDQLRRL